MKKTISVLSLALMASFAAHSATGDTATATASWQGVISGAVTPDSDGLIITGLDKARDIPVGQLMRTPAGIITGEIITLESHAYKAATTSPAAAEEIGALQKAKWNVEEAKFYVGGVEVLGTKWTVYDNQDVIATIATTGAVTDGASTTAVGTAKDTIKLRVESHVDSKDMISQYAGEEAAYSVTILATEA